MPRKKTRAKKGAASDPRDPQRTGSNFHCYRNPCTTCNPNLIDGSQPTDAVPGSIEKVEVLAERSRVRVPLFHASDARLPERVGYLTSHNHQAAAVVEENGDGTLSITGSPGREAIRMAGRTVRKAA